MPLFATEPDPGFTTKHPPLLATEGIDGVGMTPYVYGQTTTYEILLTEVNYQGEVKTIKELANEGVEVLYMENGAGNGPIEGAAGELGVPAKLLVQPVWTLKFMPYVNGLATPIDTSVSTSFTNSLDAAKSSESTISASLEASVGLDVFGISASLSGSLSGGLDNSLSLQSSMEASQSYSEEVQLAAGSAFAIWDLRSYLYLENLYPLRYNFEDPTVESFNLQCRADSMAVQMYIDSCTIDQLPV